MSEQDLSVAEARSWLTSYLANVLKIKPEQVEVETSFERYGLDSVAAIDLNSSLEKWLGYDLPLTLPYHYPSVDALSRHLAENYKKNG